MPRRRHPTPADPIEEAVRRAGSIGALERLAGIGNTPEARVSFWKPFCHLPGAQGLDAGVAELKRMIRAGAQASPARKTRSASRVRHG